MSTLNAGETLQPFKPLRNNLIFDSSGNLVGIQNDRANGTDLRLNGGSAGTFSSLVVQAAGTLELYNTADQTTNYERLRAAWVSNQSVIFNGIGGTGQPRTLLLGNSATAGGNVPTRGIAIYAPPAAATGVEVFYSTSTASTAVLGISTSTVLSASTGTQQGVNIAPTINQSGTAGYILADFNATETATGSGTKLLQRWAVGGSALAQLNNSGSFQAQSVGAVTAIGLTSALGTGSDVLLYRDAAAVLAQRNGTNAQTFRIYNTYTDASNYERAGIGFFSNVLKIGTSEAGTGASRQMTFVTAGSDRWSVTTSGHFIAATDNTYDIGASGATRPRNLYMASWIRMATTTVASLPAAGTAAAGARMFVTDANATTFASVVAGGGANTVPVYSDGTNWRIG